MTEQDTKGQRLSSGAKFAVDMGPLIVFMIAYFFGARLVSIAGNIAGYEWCMRGGAEMYLAVAAFMPAFALAFAYSVWRERRVAPMLLVSGVIIGVLGTLTLVLHNKTFFYMKPTIVYLLFGGMLFGGLATGRNFMRIVFDGALHLPDNAWRTLTIRYGTFFLALAVLNEIAWRWLTKDCAPETPVVSTGEWSWLLTACGGEEAVKCAGEARWVQLKAFGFTALSLVFTALQAPLIAKHMSQEEPKDG